MPFYKKKVIRKKPFSKTKKVYKKKGTRMYPRRRYKRAEKIALTVMSDIGNQAYFTPLAGKIGSLTPNFQTSDTTSLTLESQVITQEAFYYKGIFRQCRVKKIKVELIPEKWVPSGITDTSPITDGEKPRIHWINDDGSTAQSWDTSIDVDEAQSISGYKQREFTKNMTFWIKPYYKPPYGTSDQLEQFTSKYATISNWIPCKRGLGGTAPVDNPFRTPPGNLYFGFTNVKAGFRYRTITTTYWEFKDPYYVPP